MKPEWLDRPAILARRGPLKQLFPQVMAESILPWTEENIAYWCFENHSTVMIITEAECSQNNNYESKPSQATNTLSL